jgi:hypothetical protein
MRLAAVRRLAYEAADTGLLSPELAAGIRRVKGAKRLGVTVGNWQTIEVPTASATLRTPIREDFNGPTYDPDPGARHTISAVNRRFLPADARCSPD